MSLIVAELSEKKRKGIPNDIYAPFLSKPFHVTNDPEEKDDTPTPVGESNEFTS